jgi:hypothetical protein
MCGFAVHHTSIQKVDTFIFVLIYLQSYCYVEKNEYNSFLKHSYYIKHGLYCPEQPGRAADHSPPSSA